MGEPEDVLGENLLDLATNEDLLMAYSALTLRLERERKAGRIGIVAGLGLPTDLALAVLEMEMADREGHR